MERLKPDRPSGYVLRDEEMVAEILVVEAELLHSEGVDPSWPGFAPAIDADRTRPADDDGD